MRSFVTLVLAVASLCMQAGCIWPGKKKPTQAPSRSQTRQQRTPTRTKTSTPRSSTKAQPSTPGRQSGTPAPQSSAEPRSPTPSLSPVLSDDERRRLGESVDSHLTTARKQLASIDEKRLTTDQAETLRAIRSFMARAAHVKKSDPVLAEQLAYRAQVLAGSLAGSIR